MSTTARTLSLLLVLVSVGCGPAVQSVNFISPPLPATPSDYPIRFYGEARPKCAYQEIGSVSSRKRSKLVSMEKVMESLRERAREMGGNAIIGIGEHTETRGATIVGSTVVANNDPVLSGTVIRFDDPACTQ